jgi:ArsR family transcriptional regulator
MDLPQSTVSQHLSKLKSAGIIDGQRHGLEICYKVVDKDTEEMIRTLFKTEDSE